MKNGVPKIIVALAFVVLAGSLTSCRTDKAMARRSLRHQQNHYYVRNRFQINTPSFLAQPPWMQRFEWDMFFMAIGTIAHSHK